MASTSTSSPRNHEVDANSELSRKRQRLSESPDDGPILVEEVSLEGSGSNFGDAIEIIDDVHEDDDPAMAQLYSDNFMASNYVHHPALQILETLCRQLKDDSRYVDANIITCLSDWLDGHIDDTKDDSPRMQLKGYLDDSVFFEALATVALAFLHRSSDFFEPTASDRFGDLNDHVLRLLGNLVHLTTRFVHVLPSLLKDRLARRDSAHEFKGQQVLPFLRYVTITTTLLTASKFSGCIPEMHKELGLTHVMIRKDCSHILLTCTNTKSLVLLYGEIARNLSDISDAWQALGGLQRLIEAFPEMYLEARDFVQTMRVVIVPAIRAKHPRALPENFHRVALKTAATAVATYARKLSLLHATEFYDLHLRDEHDALIIDSDASTSTLSALQELSIMDAVILSELLKACWVLQTSKGFIESEIMDVRGCGNDELGLFLKSTYSIFQGGDSAEHPVLQYAARFLRVNEMIRYIFGANSHANLVSNSVPLVGFLAATQHYTDQDTDVIWQAVMLSVEADFVNAAIDVLFAACHHLPFDNVAYIVKLYARTPAMKLSTCEPLITLLPKLLKTLEEKALASGTKAHLLTIAFISLDLLRNLSTSISSVALRTLWNEAITALLPRLLDTGQRLEIYRSIVPDMTYRTTGSSVCAKVGEDRGVQVMQTEASRATCAFEVLSLFLDDIDVARQDAETITSMLSIADIAEEASELIRSDSTLGEASNEKLEVSMLVPRLAAIVALMSISNTKCDSPTERLVFSVFFGDRAMSNEARNTSWDALWKMGRSSASSAAAATELLVTLLEDHVPSLSLEHVTPVLVHLSTQPIEKSILADADPKGNFKLLELPLWQLLVRIATESSDSAVANLAAEMVCQILFRVPQNVAIESAIVRSQCDFVRAYLEQLGHGFSSSSRPMPSSEIRRFCTGLELLQTVLERSKTAQYTFRRDKATEAITVGEPTESNSLSFYVQLYSPHADCRKDRICVQASGSATVAELDAGIRNLTLGQDARIIVGGRLVDRIRDGARTLQDVGVAPSGVITICPRYSFDDDLDLVLTKPGPVEQEMLAQYEHLEIILDGPDEVAERALAILKSIRPSANARWRIVVADETNVDDLLPVESQWRTRFSLYVMQSHRLDFASLGVADGGFIRKCIHLLTRVVMDERRDEHPWLLIEVLRILLAFLQERPGNDCCDNYFDDKNAFASRLITLLCSAVKLPVMSKDGAFAAPIRAGLCLCAYDVLLQASRVDGRVMSAFLDHALCPEAHARLLLDADPALAGKLGEKIDHYCFDYAVEPSVIDRYWSVINATLPEALRRSALSRNFFILAGRIFERDVLLQTDEPKIRALIEAFLSALWDQAAKHVEVPRVPTVLDEAMHGILGLLRKAIEALRSLKKPVGLQGLPVLLAEKLLFPEDPGHRGLISPLSRSSVYDLIKATCETRADYAGLLRLSWEAMSTLSTDPTAKFPGQEEWLRQVPSCGIPNLGQTCYMNSLLQQMFGNVALRKFILAVPITDEVRQRFLKHVQTMFARLQASVNPTVEPWELVTALGIEPNTQEDVHSFYASFLGKLEECLPDETTRQCLNSIFSGKSISQIRGQCGHVSSRTEPFAELAITVKNKSSLHESLAEYVQGEPMQGANRYRCLACGDDEGGMLVDAVKRTCLTEIPDHLTLCLKRFTMESMLGVEGKINDRFEFPPEIDMSVYMHQHLEGLQLLTPAPDLFELTGVIVHMGTLDFGHYWSYVKLMGEHHTSRWMKLEDQYVTECQGGLQDVQNACFGGVRMSDGNMRTDSAYVLFYQRKSSMHHESGAVELPLELGQKIQDENIWRYRVSHIFSPHFIGLVEWLVEMYSTYGAAQNTNADLTSPSSDSPSIGTSDVINEDPTSEEICVGIARMAARYLERVALCDSFAATRAKAVLPGLSSALTDHAALSVHLVQCFTEDAGSFAGIWRHSNPSVRKEMSNFLRNILSALREKSSRELYVDGLGRVLKAHSSLIGPMLDGFGLMQWRDYLTFASTIAYSGPEETAMVLDHGYLAWCFDVIYLEHHSDFRPGHAELYKSVAKLDFSHQFHFLRTILGHVDLASLDVFSANENSHLFSEGGVLLTGREMKYLSFQCKRDHGHIWDLLYIGIKKCAVQVDWTVFPPGRLAAFLVSSSAGDHWFSIVESSMIARYNDEDYHLEPLLHITRHLCVARGEAMERSLKKLAKVLQLWDGIAPGRWALDCFQDTMQSAPCATIEVVPEWAPNFLGRKSVEARNRTLVWLRENLFAELRDIDPELAHAARRLRVMRAMCKILIPRLEQAHRNNHDAVPHRQTMQVVHLARAFAIKMQESAAGTLSDEEHRSVVSAELRVEVDEAAGLVAGVDSLYETLGDWDSEGMEVGAGETDSRISADLHDAEEETDIVISSDDDMTSEGGM